MLARPSSVGSLRVSAGIGMDKPVDQSFSDRNIAVLISIIRMNQNPEATHH
jgi:hypothetical protein